MSAQQFMEILFGRLPDFFKNEAELRTLLERPRTHEPKLMQGLAEKGFGRNKWRRCRGSSTRRRAICCDVLAYVAYACPRLTRDERATKRQVTHPRAVQRQQQTLLDFVLAHYVEIPRFNPLTPSLFNTFPLHSNIFHRIYLLLQLPHGVSCCLRR